MRSILTIAALLFLAVSPAFALTVSYQIGDNDGFGFGTADNADVPSVNYNNRSAAEVAAVDGSQFTDNDQLAFVGDPTFSHFFNTSLFSSIASATLTIDVQGLQPNAFGPGSLPSFLYFDGVQVPGFETIDLGAYGSQVLTYNVNLSMLADGQLDVLLDVNDFGDVPVGQADLVAVDFTRLDVTGTPVIPEPATLSLLGLGLVGLAFRRRKK